MEARNTIFTLKGLRQDPANRTSNILLSDILMILTWAPPPEYQFLHHIELTLPYSQTVRPCHNLKQKQKQQTNKQIIFFQKEKQEGEKIIPRY